MRYYLISDNIDTLTGMRLVGIEGTMISTESELILKLDEIIKDKSIAVLLITETVNNLAKIRLSDIKLNYKQPLVVVIPDRHGSGRASDSITSYVKDAIGLKI